MGNAGGVGEGAGASPGVGKPGGAPVQKKMWAANADTGDGPGRGEDTNRTVTVVVKGEPRDTTKWEVVRTRSQLGSLVVRAPPVQVQNGVLTI